MSMLRNLFDGIFSDMNETFDNARVYSETIPNDNRRFGLRFYGADMGLVMEQARKCVDSIDSYRSPGASGAYKRGDFWNVDVFWYSLD